MRGATGALEAAAFNAWGRLTGAVACSSSGAAAPWESVCRSFATDKKRRDNKPRGEYNPDAWKSRVSPKVGRIGTELKQRDPQAFERMRMLLGYTRGTRNAAQLQGLKRVTISNFQAIKYMGFPTDFKLDLLRYNLGTLNKDALDALVDSSAFLNNQASNTMDIIPQVDLQK